MPGGGELRAARETSLAALAGDERLDQLQQAAQQLGEALFATAEDRELWANLERGARPAQRARGLNAEQRDQLGGIVNLDWAWLLNEADYQPPPPAESLANELQHAMAEAIRTGRRSNVEAARKKLRSLGVLLVELSGQGDVSYRQLRRAVREGARVAGKVLIVIGVIVGSAAAAAAISAALPAVPPLVVLIGVGLLFEGGAKVLQRGVDEALGGVEREPEGEFEPADWEALERARSLRNPQVAFLVEAWREVRGQTPAELLADTRQYYTDAVRSFYGTWEAATGAVWYEAVAELFEKVDAERRRLQEELIDTDRPDPVECADRLQRFAIHAARLEEELDRIMRS